MHMVEAPHLDSLLQQIPKEVQAALVVVSDQTVIILVRVSFCGICEENLVFGINYKPCI